jgi:glycine hydroxymethyltransferase
MENLKNTDIELFNLIEKEKYRQRSHLELIASENFTSSSVLECLGSCLTNKYSEGYPNKRYYGGNQYIDQIEILCQNRALETYKLDNTIWSVNVQPYSGSPANFEVYAALLQPNDKIMGLDLKCGGHLTHGFYIFDKQTNNQKPISFTSKFFKSKMYETDTYTGLLDYEKIEQNVLEFKPKILICGGSAYPRDWNYSKFREIADKVGAILMCDMAHISGLVATDEANNPFEYCDIVTTTTHKTLRGPRAGIIFCKKEYEQKINQSVFPGLQGGPHENAIAAIATQLLEVQTSEFKEYIKQVKLNAKTLANELISKGYKLITDGTDNHLILWNLKSIGLTGSKMEKICDYVNITLNKNTIPGDNSAFSPGGVRIGSPALTSRGCKELDFIQIADFLDRIVKLALEIQTEHGKKLIDFTNALKNNNKVKELQQEIETFALQFEIP